MEYDDDDNNNINYITITIALTVSIQNNLGTATGCEIVLYFTATRYDAGGAMESIIIIIIIITIIRAKL